MKCPKCSYLGFETGNRCRNCGYEFSLMSDASLAPTEIDLPLHEPSQAASALPLFENDDFDAPLIRVPAAPRPPLAVRRTPVPPLRPRTPSPVVPRAPRVEEPALSFESDSAPAVRHDLRLRERAPADGVRPAIVVTRRDGRDAPEVAASVDAAAQAGSPIGESPLGLRALAGLIDHGILVAIDAVVLYFTLRMTGLMPDDWDALPLVPLLTFLGFVKLAYFGTFTVVGGQTIGKMVTRLRVVGTDLGPVSVTRGLWRAVAGLVSIVTFGAGLLPIFLGTERRAFHDRVAGTRVVSIWRA